MQYKKVADYVDHKNLAYAVLRISFPKSEIYIVNRHLIIINGDRYTLCNQTQHYVIKNDEYRIIFDKTNQSIQKAFRILRGNALYSNL